MEIWKSCNKFWEVSTLGRVRVLGGEPILDLCTRRGYRVFFPYGASRRFQYVHRAVMLTFCPAPSPMLNFVDHINRNRMDNRISNLRWSNPVLNGMNTGKHKWYQKLDDGYMPCKKFLGRQYRFPIEKTVAAAQGVSKRFHDQAFAATEVLSHFGLNFDLQRTVANYWAPKLKNPHIHERKNSFIRKT